MSAVLTIAWRDIREQFSSPKGAAVFWFFVMIMGFFFYSFMATFVEYQTQAGHMGGQAPTLEQLLRAMFSNLHFILILTVPALTMASFSEQKRTQAIRLLQTAPVTASQIVFGKFFACVGVMTLALLGSAVYPLFTVAYGNPDINLIWSSYLGLFLLLCSQIAFGIWISSMTSNQFMAFLFTMFGVFVLLILNWVADAITGGGVMEAIVKYIATTDHLDSFFKGMITVKDVAYFLCFSATFLLFTNVVLDSQRWR